MSTGSTITVLREDGKYQSVYCHFDGYPAGVGRMLKEHYNTQELAEAVVSLGDISFLDKSIECPDGHSFVNPVLGYSVFYHRDRGEEPEIPTICESLEEILLSLNKQAYNYIWNGSDWFLFPKNEYGRLSSHFLKDF